MTSSEFNLTNVKCAGCVSKIESRLAKLPGVQKARVNLLNKTLHVEYDDKSDNTNERDQKVIAALQEIGYGASLESLEEDSNNLWLMVGVPLGVGVILMMLGMMPSLMVDYATKAGMAVGIIYAGLTFAITWFTGRSVIKSGSIGFRTLNFNMYSLILLGITTAWIYSLGVILALYFGLKEVMPHVYFESVLIILGLVNLGSYLEEQAKNSTTSAINGLRKLIPQTTTIIVNDNEETITTDLLEAGHLVKIRPGEQLPADGIIISGDGYLDQAMLSGESLPVHKKVADEVVSGTVNTSGAFIFKVTKVGNETLLAGIINLVKTAQLSKPPLAKLADRVAKIFVPTILVVAFLSAGIWYIVVDYDKLYYALTIFMTVLIIACPCSVGLAIPVALTVGLGRGARQGILIRDASCLSLISQLEMVLIDKTGTLTKGKPEVIELSVGRWISSSEVWSILVALEQNSEHPLGTAIINHVSDIDGTKVTKDYDVSDFCSVSGRGVSGIINGISYSAISANFAAEIANDPDNLLVNNNFSQIYLVREQTIIARVNITDQLKPDSAEAIQALKNRGLQVAMLTGDNEATARYIARECGGIDQVYANCSPKDKARIIKELQSSGKKVAFIGDGINDAPSLVQADVGIAMGNGSDIAVQSAAISLLHNSLMSVVDSLELAAKINRNMRQNLFGSFVYNTVAVLIAAGVIYPWWHILLNPVIASVAMSLSSLTVILNALRLRE